MSEEPIKIPENQFRCACCGEIFDKGWSEDEAKAELERNFQGADVQDCDLVCDPCYKQFIQ